MDGARFCRSCGQPLPASNPQAAWSDAGSVQQPYGNAAGTPKKGIRAFHVVAALLAIAAAFLVAAVAVSVITGSGPLDILPAGSPGGGAAASGSAASDSQDIQVSPQKDVDSYSWDELKQISKMISEAPSDEEGLKIAEQYHLCTSDGKLDGTQMKYLALTDGTWTAVQVAGFRHDDKSDGSGKAGITFIFRDGIAEQPMNASNTSSGGWQASQMRSWLASSGMDLMPDDLRKDIISVKKLTNNTGETTDLSAVTTTDDQLWLFSNIELGGNLLGWEDCKQLMQAEGSPYQLFSEAKESSGSDYQKIRTKNYQSNNYIIWWERSPCPEYEAHFGAVDTIPDPDYCESAYESHYVVPGFCI